MIFVPQTLIRMCLSPLEFRGRYDASEVAPAALDGAFRATARRSQSDAGKLFAQKKWPQRMESSLAANLIYPEGNQFKAFIYRCKPVRRLGQCLKLPYNTFMFSCCTRCEAS
jgi:hypothetical protein